MKRLWKCIPPCLSDVLGFEALLNATDGLGIIDDPSRYKPIGWGKFGRGGHSPEGGMALSFEHRERRMWENGEPIHGGFGGHGGRGRGDLRVVNSDIRNTDIITGTEKKVLAAFEENAGNMNPAFVLLCHAPSSSMIGSDLEANATQIQEMSHVPAAYVNIDGGKDYLYGIGMTLEAIGRLLLAGRETIPGTVNLLGCNSIDWTEDMRRSAEGWLSDNGLRVLSCWGMKETAECLKASAAAEKNLVVSEAGLRLARYMERELGIPYVIGAPFGKAACETIVNELRGGAEKSASEDGDGPSVLIVGEQLMANALRASLRERGYRGVRVLSFYDMDKTLMETGDAKLISEDDLAKQLNAESVRLILCDPDMRPLLAKEAQWIKLANPGASSAYETVAPFNMVESKLDLWLDQKLNGGSVQ